MAAPNVEQPGLSQNPSVDETANIHSDNLLKIFKDFLASNAQVYKFQGRLGVKECNRVKQRVKQMCDSMGLSSEVIKKKNAYWIVYAYKNEGELSNQIQELVSRRLKRKRNECKTPMSFPQKISQILARIWVSQVLEKILASGDEVYSFENKLSGEERREVFEFCQKMGFIYTLSWHGIKQIVSIHKTKKDVDNKALLESLLPHVAVSKGSDQADMVNKSNNKEELAPPQDRNFIAIDPKSKRLPFSLKLQHLVSSKDEVYKFEQGLSLTKCELVHQLSQEMGLSCTFYGHDVTCEVFVYKTKKVVDTCMVLESLPHVTFLEETNQNKEEFKPPHYQNSVDELTRISISQTLGNVFASKDKVDTFEAKLSPEECVAVHDLSPEMRSEVGNSGTGIKHTISVQKPKNVGTITELENLPRFTFSEKSKQLLGGLLMHSPPGNEDLPGIVRTSDYSTVITERKEDDIFGRPEMSKADITKQLEDRDARMNTSVLKQITYKRSMLPIASFKDAITSTIESHQVVIICGDKGCGKSTQVPQYILDHMWGKGEVCKIVCTQPQHISATTVSERISQERGETVGNNVGYKTLLNIRGGRQSSVVFCTARVLLKDLVSKRFRRLKTWSMKDDISSITHIVMDEIQERDQYSDLLLAFFREKLPSNPHLRLIVMSATGNSARFSQYFGDCPVILVPGLTYPVRTYYLEDVLDNVKSAKYRNCCELSQDQRLSLDEALSLAWFNDEWFPLLDLIRLKGNLKVFNYQHSLTGLNPLMVFAGKGRVSDMCMLLSLGVNCHLSTTDGTTALQIAEEKNQHFAAELLKQHIDNDIPNRVLHKYLATDNPTLVDYFLIEQLIRKLIIDSKDGGILVFLPGLDEINITQERLLESPFFNDAAKFMVISLHPMVPYIEQKKVFMCPPPGCRKIVLSTNIAETAFTIDDIVYVIDTGRVKETFYGCNDVSTVQSSWVSKESAKLREGCAGCCQHGICYHLYSKFQAVSLPDFQLPEIKRMPIDELCLLVKLLDPSCKIEDFLNRMIDPPDFESIQYAIRALQKIGALSFDENLTQLGEKLGSLPVHPSASRMLLFSILMNCLDPALTLACASELGDPFSVQISADEKKRLVAARSELTSLYGDCDQFAVVTAFECWENSVNMDLEAKFCSEYCVSDSFMKMLFCMRKELETELFQNGLIHGNVQKYSLNAHDPGILHAVYFAGMYPMVGKVCLPKGSRNKVIVKTERSDKVSLDRCSTKLKLLSQTSSDCSLVVYDGITRDDWGNMRIRNCTVVGLLPLLLHCTEIAVVLAKDCEWGGKLMSSPNDTVKVIMDRWLEFESTALDISHLNYLRGQLSAVQHSSDGLPPDMGIAIDMLACILSCDGQISDHADNEDPEGTVHSDQGASNKNAGTRLSKKKKKNAGTRSNFKRVAVGWTPPEIGWIKANVDGSIANNLNVSCGGVFRDSMGSWCFGFARNLGHRFSGATGYPKVLRQIERAEHYGILTAIELAMKQGISQLWIDCDSEPAVNSVLRYKEESRRGINSSPLNSVVKAIVELMNGNIRVCLSHTPRKLNKVADWLTTYAHDTDVGLHVIYAPPEPCIRLLKEDVAGVGHFRSVHTDPPCNL